MKQVLVYCRCYAYYKLRCNWWFKPVYKRLILGYVGIFWGCFFFLFVDIFGRLMSCWKASLTEKNLLGSEVSVGRPGRLQPRRNSAGRRSVWRKVLEDRLEILCP